MVDALSEARRVLRPEGVLVNVRPVNAPMVVDVVCGARAVWARTVQSYSVPEDVAAAGAVMERAVACRWFSVIKIAREFDFQIYCDTVAELRSYAEDRKLYGEAIPFQELERRQHQAGIEARLRCHRPWMVSTYRKV